LHSVEEFQTIEEMMKMYADASAKKYLGSEVHP
jgi:hypothetical protein